MPADGARHHGLMKLHLTRDAFGPSLKLTRSQADRYSVADLVHAAIEEDVERLNFYRAISDDVQAATGTVTTTHRSFYLPPDYMTRDLTTGSGPGGGYLVATERGFVGELFNASLVGRLPLRTLPLKGNAALGAAVEVSTAWQAGESAEITHADPSFGARTLLPKTIGAVVMLSRQFHIQLGADGNRFIEQQLGRALAQAVDQAFADGSGVNGQPVGMLRVDGATSTSGTNLGWSGVRDLIASAEGHAADDLVFLLGVGAAKVLRAREKATGSGMVFTDGKIDGIPVIVSRSLPTDSLLLAPWSTVVMGTWAPIEITVSPYTSSDAFRAGKVAVRLLWQVDFVPEHVAAVARSTGIT